jgi:hypothetical protein
MSKLSLVQASDSFVNPVAGLTDDELRPTRQQPRRCPVASWCRRPQRFYISPSSLQQFATHLRASGEAQLVGDPHGRNGAESAAGLRVAQSLASLRNGRVS